MIAETKSDGSKAISLGQKVASYLKPSIPVAVTGLCTLFGVIGGAYLTNQSTNRNLDIRMVLIGLSILKGDPPPKEDQTNLSADSGKASLTYADTTADPTVASDQTRRAREYAVHLLETYSGDIGDFSEEDFWKKWAEQGGVPGDLGKVTTGWYTTGETYSSGMAETEESSIGIPSLWYACEYAACAQEYLSHSKPLIADALRVSSPTGTRRRSMSGGRVLCC